jgi:hypothetical protein
VSSPTLSAEARQKALSKLDAEISHKIGLEEKQALITQAKSTPDEEGDEY